MRINMLLMHGKKLKRKIRTSGIISKMAPMVKGTRENCMKPIKPEIWSLKFNIKSKARKANRILLPKGEMPSILNGSNFNL